MKAVRIHRHGGPDVLQFEEVPDPPVLAGQVRVRIKATSINHMDIWIRNGLPSVRTPLPIIPGVDASGIVESVGAGVTHVSSGDRVVVAQGISCGHCVHCLNGDDNLCRSYILIGEHRDGADAELITVPERNILPLPASLSFEETAAAALVFLTAWHMIAHKARVTPGQTVFVHGAGSGVGSAAVQIARLFGAKVFASTSSDEKVKRTRQLGADEVFRYDTGSVSEFIRKITGKNGVDVIIDHVGATVWEESIKSLAKGGKIVTCGATSGYDARTDLRYVFYKQLSIIGSTMGKKGDLVTILRLLEEKKLHAVIHEVMPLADVKRAHAIVEAGKQFGKVVLTV